jgi:phosphoribosylamine---glycine ligase
VKVLLIGSGGREHALAWAIARSPRKPEIFAAPGNAGLAGLARIVPVSASDTEALLRFAEEERIDLTIVGPETPLVAGLVDRFLARGLRVFGPRARAAMIEGSKIYAKDLMRRAGIATAAFDVVGTLEEAAAVLRRAVYPTVIKADGLAAGKGVVIARDAESALRTVEKMMVGRQYGAAGERIVIEEFLTGEEVSVFALCRGSEYLLLPTAQDHKRLLDGDQGPNTGGMGAYAPYPRWDPALEERVRRDVIAPTLRTLDADGCPFFGLLYCGLMVRDGIPSVLEYNCRFGDPETQAVVPLIGGDLLEAFDEIASHTPGPVSPLVLEEGAAAVVVLASRGYPASFGKGYPIRGIAEATEGAGALVFHAGTRRGPGGPVTDGGRVLGVVGTGKSLRLALAKAYEGVEAIDFEGKTYRADIGKRGLES